jgi:hypothetical protein
MARLERVFVARMSVRWIDNPVRNQPNHAAERPFFSAFIRSIYALRVPLLQAMVLEA